MKSDMKLMWLIFNNLPEFTVPQINVLAFKVVTVGLYTNLNDVKNSYEITFTTQPQNWLVIYYVPGTVETEMKRHVLFHSGTHSVAAGNM